VRLLGRDWVLKSGLAETGFGTGGEGRRRGEEATVLAFQWFRCCVAAECRVSVVQRCLHEVELVFIPACTQLGPRLGAARGPTGRPWTVDTPLSGWGRGLFFLGGRGQWQVRGRDGRGDSHGFQAPSSLAWL
jgi:hypothetical protein